MLNSFVKVRIFQDNSDFSAFPRGQILGPISETLAEYLIGWMGGPPLYHDNTGTVCLTDPHAAYHIGPKETEQWLLCFDAALEAINASDEVKNMLHGPIRQVAAAVQNRDHSNAAEQDPNIIAVSRI